MGHGRRALSSIEQFKNSQFQASVQALKGIDLSPRWELLAEAHYTDGQGTAQVAHSPQKALERLLLGSNAAAAFNPSNPFGIAVGNSAPTAPRLKTLQKQFPRVQQLPKMNEESLQDPTATESARLKSLLAVASDQEKLDSLMDEEFANFTQEEMKEVMTRSDSDESWKLVGQAHQRAVGRSMERGKQTLEDLLDTGDIQKMDAKLVKIVKNGSADPGFILVLNQNIDAAQREIGREGGADHESNSKLNILMHVSSRIQEELEKKAKPETGVLHKLMRTEDVGLRGRILSHYLLPQKEIKMPDGSFIPVDKPTNALVEPMKFSEAVTELCGQLRGFDADGDTIMAMLEDVRQIAIAADGVIQEGYPESLLTEFRESLTQTFEGVRAAAKEKESEQTPP